MGEKYQNQLDKLAELLLTPDKVGRVALAELYTPVELAQLELEIPKNGTEA